MIKKNCMAEKRVLLVVSLAVSILLTACSKEKTSDLTTQSRSYEKTEESKDAFAVENDRNSHDETMYITDNEINRDEQCEAFTGEDYIDYLAKRLGMEKNECIDAYGVVGAIQKSGGTLTDGLARVYDDVDFEKTSIPIKNESVADSLVLNSVLQKADEEIYYYEKDIENNNRELGFTAIIHPVKKFVSTDELGVFFKESKRVSELVDFYKKDPYSDINGFVTLNITLTNKSDQEYGVFVNNFPIYSDYGTIGIYNILVKNYVYMDYSHNGGARGNGKDIGRLYLKPGETADVELLYADISYSPTTELYLSLTPLIRFGFLHDDGTYHPNSESGLKLYKLEMEE